MLVIWHHGTLKKGHETIFNTFIEAGQQSPGTIGGYVNATGSSDIVVYFL